MTSFHPAAPSFARHFETDWQEAPTSKRLPPANLIARSRPSSIPPIPVQLDTEPPVAMRNPSLRDPTGPAIPIEPVPDDAPSNRPTLPAPSHVLVVGEPRPGPCPTPFGMAVPPIARSGVHPIAPESRVEHGPGRWLLPILSIAAMSGIAFAIGAGVTWVRGSRGSPGDPVAMVPARSTTAAPSVGSANTRTAKQLAAIPAGERTVDDNLALAEHRREGKQRELGKLRAGLVSKPAPDPEAVAKLRGYLEDGETTQAALGVIARMPGPAGPDLLYEVWTSTPEETEATRTAHDLVLSRDVRPHASPALAASLDLREAERCEAIRDILPRVWAHGDRRALTTLVRIARSYPCRTGRSEQCHPCLRGTVSLHDTIETIKGRAPPVY